MIDLKTLLEARVRAEFARQFNIQGGQGITVQGGWPCPTVARAFPRPEEAPAEAPSDDCCMYVWPDPDGTPLYAPEDLPATILYNGDTLTLDAGLYQFTGATYYIVAGTTQWEVRLISDDSLVASFDCLISNGVEDEFCQSYLVEFDALFGGGSSTVERVSVCRWTGTMVGGDNNGTTVEINGAPPFFVSNPDGGAGTYQSPTGGDPAGLYEGVVTVTCADPP